MAVEAAGVGLPLTLRLLWGCGPPLRAVPGGPVRSASGRPDRCPQLALTCHGPQPHLRCPGASVPQAFCDATGARSLHSLGLWGQRWGLGTRVSE